MQFYQNNNHKLCGVFWQIKYLFLKTGSVKRKIWLRILKKLHRFRSPVAYT